MSVFGNFQFSHNVLKFFSSKKNDNFPMFSKNEVSGILMKFNPGFEKKYIKLK